MSTHRQLPNNTDIAPWQKKGRWYHLFFENNNSNPTPENPGTLKLIDPPASDYIDANVLVTSFAKEISYSPLLRSTTCQGVITPLTTTDEITDAHNLVLGHVFKVDNNGNYTATDEVVPFNFASNFPIDTHTTSTTPSMMYYTIGLSLGRGKRLFITDIKCTSAVDISGSDLPLSNLSIIRGSGAFQFICSYSVIHTDIWIFAHIEKS